MAALADFIDEAREEIAQAWEEFARTLEPGASRLYLRDHIEEILKAIVADMRTAQSAKQQVAKSEGNAEQGPLALIGQTHASERIETGFHLDQVMAEYRALRASVLGLWESRGGNADSSGITRFNEAIDEALTEAVAIYVEKTERYRDESLGILGHDLRNPLGAIHMGATLLLKTETLDDRSARVAGRILTGAKRMERLVRDLLDLTRTRLGKGIPIVTIAMDLEPLCGQIVAELEAVHPDRHLRYECEGDLRGEWDSDRLGQVLSNLVGNALEHGAEGGPVDLIARGRVDDILVEVHNGGPPIPPAALPTLFEPMVRHPRSDGNERSKGGLGLGLHIACQIVVAHGGKLTVTSSEADGTRFTVLLPRRSPTRREDRMNELLPRSD